MTQYTLDVNGKRYELNEEFREALERRAKNEYSKNPQFSCWWKVEDGDPILVIETTGVMVPWDRLDQMEMHMQPEPPDSPNNGQQQGQDDVDSGNGMAEVKPPEDDPSPRDVNFGRTHFGITPHHYDEVPHPGGEHPKKVPPKPDEVDEPMMVMWVPQHPDVDVTWSAGEAITEMYNWVEWNVQEKADQPRPSQDKNNSHDAFESLCKIRDCEKIGEYTPTNDIPKDTSGQVERKGEQAYEEGKYGGGHWSV